MGSNRQPGISLTPASIQSTLDGLLCRQPPPSTISAIFEATVTAVTSPPVFVYCHLWSSADRGAFWRGFYDRAGEFGEEFKGYFVWFRKAFLFGEKEGDFADAWKGFASGIGDLAELSWKVSVVIGMPPPLQFHPKRDEYAQELKRLGLAITNEFTLGYKRCYTAGGIPQCTGRLLADLLRIVFELLAAKGAGKLAAGAGELASSGKIAEVLERLPGPLKTLPEKLAARPTRWQLIDYIKHDEKVAMYARGVLYDLKPGEYLVRVEARGAATPGNWFNGPFKTPAEAQSYGKYLADLGEKGIRNDSALPLVWSDGAAGNKIEVVRIYKVTGETPAISSVVAPQTEGVAKATGGAKAAAKQKVLPGQGQQLSLPVTMTKKVHGIDLVERMNHLEISITKP
jgi:hypothetical protein